MVYARADPHLGASATPDCENGSSGVCARPNVPGFLWTNPRGRPIDPSKPPSERPGPTAGSAARAGALSPSGFSSHHPLKKTQRKPKTKGKQTQPDGPVSPNVASRQIVVGPDKIALSGLRRGHHREHDRHQTKWRAAKHAGERRLYDRPHEIDLGSRTELAPSGLIPNRVGWRARRRVAT